jgi:hypothetical protein
MVYIQYALHPLSLHVLFWFALKSVRVHQPQVVPQ